MTRVLSTPPDVLRVQDIVAVKFGLTRFELLMRTHRRRVAWPRQIAIYICSRVTTWSTQDIADAFGMDRANVSYAIKTVANAMTTDHVARKTVGQATATFWKEGQA